MLAEQLEDALRENATAIQAFTHGPVWPIWQAWAKFYADDLYRKAVEGSTPEIREEARIYWQAYKKFSAIPFAMVSELESISREASAADSQRTLDPEMRGK